jgi:hypothetical protein
VFHPGKSVFRKLEHEMKQNQQSMKKGRAEARDSLIAK